MFFKRDALFVEMIRPLINLSLLTHSVASVLKLKISHHWDRNEVIVFSVKRCKFSFLSVSVNEMYICETATKCENETWMLNNRRKN